MDIPTTSTRMTPADDATEWLAHYITSKGGEEDSATIKMAGRDAGYSVSRLARARAKLGVTVVNSHTAPMTTRWALPAERTIHLDGPRSEIPHTCATNVSLRQIAALLLHRLREDAMGQSAVWDEVSVCPRCIASFVGLLADMLLLEYRLYHGDDMIKRQLEYVVLKATEATP